MFKDVLTFLLFWYLSLIPFLLLSHFHLSLIVDKWHSYISHLCLCFLHTFLLTLITLTASTTSTQDGSSFPLWHQGSFTGNRVRIELFIKCLLPCSSTLIWPVSQFHFAKELCVLHCSQSLVSLLPIVLVIFADTKVTFTLVVYFTATCIMFNDHRSANNLSFLMLSSSF